MEAVGYLVRISFSPQKVTHRCLWVIFFVKYPKKSQFRFQHTSGIALCNSFRVFMDKETGIEPEGWVLMQRRWLRGNLGHLPGHWLFGLCVTLSGRRNGRWC